MHGRRGLDCTVVRQYHGLHSGCADINSQKHDGLLSKRSIMMIALIMIALDERFGVGKSLFPLNSIFSHLT